MFDWVLNVSLKDYVILLFNPVTLFAYKIVTHILKMLANI